MDREKMERSSVERQLADRVKELIDLQARFDAHNAEANARYTTGFRDVIHVDMARPTHTFYDH